MPQGFVLEPVGYTDQGFDPPRGNHHRTARQGHLKAQFTKRFDRRNERRLFGKDKKGAGLLSAWTGRPDPA